MLCREIASEADAAGGKSRSILRVLQAAKVEATGGDARAAGGRFPRDLAVFDHEHLSDPTKAAALSVVFVRWEAMDGLGGCAGGPRRRRMTRREEKRDTETSTTSSTSPPPFAAARSRASRVGSRGGKRHHSKEPRVTKLFGHVPEGTTVRVRRMRVPAAGAEGAPLDGSAPRETCELRLATDPSRARKEALAAASFEGDGDAIVALDGLAAVDPADPADAADDAWLGAETRCVFEAAPAAGFGSRTPAAAAPDGSAWETVPDPDARVTKVTFHYLYHRGKLRKTESTVGMTCPLCMRDADAFGALARHMEACHGRFKFAFFPRGDAGPASAPEPGNRFGRPPVNEEEDVKSRGDESESPSRVAR